MQALYDILGKIKTENRRLTSARVGILKAVSLSKKPLEKKSIDRWLKKNKILADRSTIYRQLRFLIGKKILNRFQLESGKIYYELFGEHHHHLVCLRCKQIANIRVDGCRENFNQLFLENSNFKVLGHSLEFYGICKDCSAKIEDGKKN